MGNKKAKLTAILSFFAIAVLIMFRDAFRPGYMLFGNDTITIYMAFADFAKKVFTQFHSMPAWLPDIYLGMPMIGSSSLLYFYPTDFLFMLLPVKLQYMFVPDLVIHMFIAAAGMYLFLKRLKIEQPAAFFGASAIMVSGFMITFVYAGHWNNIKAGALIPFTFYFMHRALEDKKLLHYLNTALMLALMILATGMQVMAYTFLAAVCYAGFYIIFIEKERKQKIKSAAYMAACSLFILLFSAPQFIPSMQYTDLSWRGDVSYSDFISWSFHPAETIALLMPQIFGLFGGAYWGYMSFTLTAYYFGVLPFLLLFFLGVPGKHRKQALFFGAAAAVFTIFAYGGYTFIYKIFYYIPVFKQFRNPSRFLYLVTFFVIALASIALNNLLESRDEKINLRSWKWLAGSAALFLVFFALSLGSGGIDSMLASAYSDIKKSAMPAGVLSVTREMIRQDLLSFLFVSASALAILLLVIKRKLKSVFIAGMLLAAVNFADMYRIDSKFITFEEYDRFIPARNAMADALRGDREQFRVANFEQLFGMNRNIYYGLDGVRGMHGLMPTAFARMERAGCFGNVIINRQINVRYYINSGEINVPGFEKFMAADSVFVYKDTGAKNRVFFADRIIRTGGGQAALDYMTGGNFSGNEVVTGPDFPAFDPGTGTVISGAAGVEKYEPGRVKAFIDSEKGGIVVFSETYYRQWKATIDGLKTKVYPVNFSSMGIYVPAGGRHEIVFYYDKSGIYAGLALALAALIFYVYILIRTYRPGK